MKAAHCVWAEKIMVTASLTGANTWARNTLACGSRAAENENRREALTPRRFFENLCRLANLFGRPHRLHFACFGGERRHQMIELVAGAHCLRGHVTAIVRVDRSMQRLAPDNLDSKPA